MHVILFKKKKKHVMSYKDINLNCCHTRILSLICTQTSHYAIEDNHINVLDINEIRAWHTYPMQWAGHLFIKGTPMQTLIQNLEDAVEQMERNGDAPRKQWLITSTAGSLPCAVSQGSLKKAKVNDSKPGTVSYWTDSLNRQTSSHISLYEAELLIYYLCITLIELLRFQIIFHKREHQWLV